MNIDQWISCISEAYSVLGKTFSSSEKDILLRKLSKNNEKRLNNESDPLSLFNYGIWPESFESQDKIANEIIEETIEIIKRYFFKKAAHGETFGPISRIKERFGNSLEENYGLSRGPFINMASTYWTYKIEVEDLLPGHYNLVISQVLLNMEKEIASVFFPTPGPVVIWVRQRREMQRRLLEQYAPEIDIDTFLENSPLLGTYPGSIAERVFNEKIWIRCPNSNCSTRFLKIPNTIRQLKATCPSCKISFQFPAQDLKWLNQLPPHIHPEPNKIEELENLRQRWNIPEGIFSLHIFGSPWAVRRVQEYMLASFHIQKPKASEKELWKMVLESRMTTQLMYGGCSKTLNEEEIDKIIHEASSFEELCDYLIEFEEKNTIESLPLDPFGIGAKIDEIFSR